MVGPIIAYLCVVAIVAVVYLALRPPGTPIPAWLVLLILLPGVPPL